jgi:transcriptional regulator with XRE-family HTH domain
MMCDDEIYRLLGRRLRLRRRLLDLTQGQVAARCGLTFQQIQKYEAGGVAIPFGRLVTLASILEMPIEDLVQGVVSGDTTSSDRRGSEPIEGQRLSA